MRVSFDFDSTLDRSDVQQFAAQLVNRGLEVWIVTSRFSDAAALERRWTWITNQNAKLFEIANQCGILPEHIIFTNGQSKAQFLDGFLFHLDDDEVELEDIVYVGLQCQGVDVSFDSWQTECLNILEKCS